MKNERKVLLTLPAEIHMTDRVYRKVMNAHRRENELHKDGLIELVNDLRTFLSDEDASRIKENPSEILIALGQSYAALRKSCYNPNQISGMKLVDGRVLAEKYRLTGEEMEDKEIVEQEGLNSVEAVVQKSRRARRELALMISTPKK